LPFAQPKTTPEKYVQLALIEKRGVWVPPTEIVELARDLGDADGHSPARVACVDYLTELVNRGQVESRHVYANAGRLVRLP
jgi:hypothetical protein